MNFDSTATGNYSAGFIRQLNDQALNFVSCSVIVPIPVDPLLDILCAFPARFFVAVLQIKDLDKIS